MTKPQLKLVASAPTAHPRPYLTMYYGSIKSTDGQWAAKGRAGSARGALRAAFMRVLDRRAEKAVVHDEAGVVVARVWRDGRAIAVTGSAVIAKALP